MDWHTTGDREELVLALDGRVELEWGPAVRPPQRVPLPAGRCAWLDRAVRHRVVNRTRRLARYVYITASAAGC